MPDTFVSPSLGELTFPEVIFQVAKFMHAAPKERYRIMIGTDSQNYNGQGVDFVTAVIVHRIGLGGIYFWQREKVKRNYVLRDRIYEEAMRSLNFAQDFIEACEREGILGFNLVIHVDIGDQGETRTMINEVVGMIRGSGFEVETKPEAIAASSVADRHT